jgi:hypothetical protein
MLVTTPPEALPAPPPVRSPTTPAAPPAAGSAAATSAADTVTNFFGGLELAGDEIDDARPEVRAAFEEKVLRNRSGGTRSDDLIKAP